MSKSNDQNLKDSLQQYLAHYRLKDKANEFKLVSKWEKIVGTFIGKYTEELKVKDKKLYIRVNSSTVKHQLMISREKIVELINTEMGQGYIKEIVLL